jgi:hypothetical protein
MLQRLLVFLILKEIDKEEKRKLLVNRRVGWKYDRRWILIVFRYSPSNHFIFLNLPVDCSGRSGSLLGALRLWYLVLTRFSRRSLTYPLQSTKCHYQQLPLTQHIFLKKPFLPNGREGFLCGKEIISNSLML